MRLIDADALMVSKQWENCTCPAQVIHNAPTIDPKTLAEHLRSCGYEVRKCQH